MLIIVETFLVILTDSFPIVPGIAARACITENCTGTQQCREDIFEMEKLEYTFRGRKDNPKFTLKDSILLSYRGIK